MSSSPPPTVACARVLWSAEVDDSVTYTGKEDLAVAGEQLGPRPLLVIAVDLETSETRLYRCDAAWDVVGFDVHESAAEAKEAAERYYDGIAAWWRPAAASEDEALAYFRQEHADELCSFCDRMPWQLRGWITNNDVRICYDCVARIRVERDAANSG